MRRVAVLMGVLGVALALGRGGAADPKPTPTLQEDLTHLRGSWSTSKKAPMTWKVTFRQTKDKAKTTSGRASWAVSGTTKTKKTGGAESTARLSGTASG